MTYNLNKDHLKSSAAVTIQFSVESGNQLSNQNVKCCHLYCMLIFPFVITFYIKTKSV